MNTLLRKYPTSPFYPRYAPFTLLDYGGGLPKPYIELKPPTTVDPNMDQTSTAPFWIPAPSN
jgi:hypothetical protein